MQPGYANLEGTRAWRMHHASHLNDSQWRRVGDCTISPVGLGTYLGAPDTATDTHYEEAILHYLELGGNIIDSAVNYRWQSSERAIGRALAKAFAAGIPRESIFVSTKGGFIPGDVQAGLDGDAYISSQLVEPGIIAADDIVAGCHCMTPAYLRHQVDSSRNNLGLGVIDLYYVHNPEVQLEEISHAEFLRRISAAFETCEQLVTEGKIRHYGCATWNAFRVPSTDKTSVGLEELLKIANDVGGETHHFSAVQMPLNLAMPEAMMARTQMVKGEKFAAIPAAERLGLTVITSAPLMQSQLLRKLPPRVTEAFHGYETPAARLLAFVINTPGVTAAMCGMKQLPHVGANWEATTHPRLTPDDWLACVRRLQG